MELWDRISPESSRDSGFCSLEGHSRWSVAFGRWRVGLSRSPGTFRMHLLQYSYIRTPSLVLDIAIIQS